MTSPDLTPTPPADTRQQAAEAVVPLKAARRAVLRRVSAQRLDRAEGEALCDDLTALASSSPALPEPPAPVTRDHGAGDVTTIWPSIPPVHTWADNPRLHVAGRTITPAQARLLASTLLAAADVAEEQQP